MSLKRNVIANYLGQAWVALMGLAFVPLYIRYLGMESYGLIGLFAVMQAWLGLLDMGMTPTLGREMARFTAGAHTPQSIRNLLRSLELVALGLATATGTAVWVASGWLARDWLKAQQLPTEVVRDAIAVMAVVIALRLVEGIYRSALFGLQRHVAYNAMNASLATLRSVGAVFVLVSLSPTIEAFFVWQVMASLLTVLLLGATVHRFLPPSPAPAVFSRDAVQEVWRFAGGMATITLLSLLLTQVDKLLLSRLLPLEAFGHYTLAATAAGALYLVITPITTALFPRLVELLSQDDRHGLSIAYHRGAQLVTVLTAPVALLLAFFADGVLFAWSGDADLARTCGPILAVLSIGTFLNGLMYVPYQLQLAHGWTSLAIKINVMAVSLLVPAILWVVPRHGALGAAWIWIVLNAGYVLVGISLMHRRLIPVERWRWYGADVGLPTMVAGISLLLWGSLKPADLENRGSWVTFLAGGLSIAMTMSLASAEDLRMRVLSSIRRAPST